MNNKKVDEAREALEKEHGRKISDEEMTKVTDFLKLLAKITVAHTMKESGRLHNLKTNPKGFHQEEGGTCPVCGSIEKQENLWYDRHGIKCLTCQNAIDKRIIPSSLCKQRDSHYCEWELGDKFNLKGKVLNTFIKNGLLKVRIIPRLDKGIYRRLFLLKDNKDFLPPKKLVSSHWTRDDRDGKKEYACLPWYNFYDPKEHLASYGISHYLKFVPVAK